MAFRPLLDEFSIALTRFRMEVPVSSNIMRLRDASSSSLAALAALAFRR